MLSSPRQYATVARQRDVKFENDIVDMLLTHHGLANFRRELLRVEEELFGERRLTLARFYARFRSFPMYLVPQRLPKKLAVKPERLLLDVSMHNLAKLYDEGRAKVPQHRRWYGLVVKWPHLKQPLVFSNVGDSNAKGTRLLCRTENGVYCLEELTALIRRLEWRPEDYETQ